MILLILLILLAAVSRTAAKARVAGRPRRAAAFTCLSVIAMASILATPWYAARIHTDAMFAIADGGLQPFPELDAATAQSMGNLSAAGYTDVATFVEAYSEGSIEQLRAGLTELKDELPWTTRAFDLGRYDANVATILEQRNEQAIPLLFVGRTAELYCTREPWRRAWRIALAADYPTATEAAPAALQQLMDDCEGVQEAVDVEAIRDALGEKADTPLNHYWFLWQILTLTYTPGHTHG